MRPARTVLEQLIRERRMTMEEFADYAETFARNHGEVGTLSKRHLHRLATGQRGDGKPLGEVRPATARLLEKIFNLTIEELLAPPSEHNVEDDPDTELRQRLHAAVPSMPRSLNSCVGSCLRSAGSIGSWVL
ncbi:hypothetical protein [Saccharothrix coeruleofusca]|uniref:Uncharacterized protein n=1 Tax=Saccharothrix coeruleofusca TaxID=33919 RepID=A0A918AHV2_9PSEU|nr:hypothetical protein [Saccharothrix coeruleofusca]GGP41984.1 hypothetical protein GCM10010185_11580 [Saccharothrix coeruleofusca]